YALTALTNLLIFSSDSAEGSRSVMFWMLGSLSLGRWNAFLAIAIGAALVGTLVMLAGARILDALSAGDEIAHGLGIHPDRARVGFLLVVSLCTAAAVAGAGAIGFVGLVIPHLARRLVGARHRVLIPASALLGALFLLWADAVARVVMQPRELPIGVLTAAIGAPFLLILVRRLYAREHSPTDRLTPSRTSILMPRTPPSPSPALRRRTLMAGLVGAVGLPAACGSAPSTGSASDEGAGDAAGFPLELPNCEATLHFDAPPERIVLLEPAPVTTLDGIGVLDRVVSRAGAFPDGYYDEELTAKIAGIPTLSDEIDA